jgi:hypothetical protein
VLGSIAIVLNAPKKRPGRAPGQPANESILAVMVIGIANTGTSGCSAKGVKSAFDTAPAQNDRSQQQTE